MRDPKKAGRVILTLFDFDTDAEDGSPLRIQSTMAYDPLMGIEDQGHLKVSLHVGDDVASGSVTLPFNMLTQLVAQTMQQHERAKAQKNGLVGIKPPKIILPN